MTLILSFSLSLSLVVHLTKRPIIARIYPICHRRDCFKILVRLLSITRTQIRRHYQQQQQEEVQVASS